MTRQQSPVVEKHNHPLISVIMNCYNGERYLKSAIDSVISQTYQNWEIIFWDNQSTDRSAEVFKSYGDSRLRYFYAPKHTFLYEARNYAVEKATGEFFAFLDVDDWWDSRKLEKQILLFSDSEVGFVCGNYWIVNERNNKRWRRFKDSMPTDWVLDDLLKSYFVGMLTLMVRRSAWNSLDYPCDTRYHVIGDFDLAVRLSLNWKLDSVQEPIAFYRLHGNNESAKHRSRHIDELNCWLREMSEVSVIHSSKGWKHAQNNNIYLNALHEIFQGNKKLAYCISRGLSWGNLKLRLWVALLLPPFIFRRLKN